MSRRMQGSTGEVGDDLPRVLLENYLLLAAAIETQNLGRLPDMLQYCQKVHHNLLEVMQQVEDAPTLAMTAGQPDPETATDDRGFGGGTDGTDAAHAAQTAATAAAERGGGGGGGPQQQTHAGAQPAASGRQSVLQQHVNTHQRLQASQPLQQVQQQQRQQHQVQHPPPEDLPPPPQQQQQQQHQHPLQQQQHAWADVPGWLQQVNVSVEQLLSGIGLSQFVPLLEEQQVDLAALQLMEERHLRELGLPIGAVVKIKAALAAQLRTT